MKVTVLGASGMLGSMVLSYLARDPDIELSGVVRNRELLPKSPRFSKVKWRLLDAQDCTVENVAEAFGDSKWAINAIGIIKPYIHDNNAAEVERAVAVNAAFPHLLAHAARETGCRVLQIATDCVYSGHKGHYNETDAHDPLDVYGKTKSLGEVYSDMVNHLRCSIIGPEPKAHVSLMDWLVRQPKDAKVSGYTNQMWNGVTTYHFGKLCRGIIKENIALPHIQHIIPTGEISKAGMLFSFAKEYKRPDITITPAPATVNIDRTLSTSNQALNTAIWKAAGYATPPTVEEMVAETAAFGYDFA